MMLMMITTITLVVLASNLPRTYASTYQLNYESLFSKSAQSNFKEGSNIAEDVTNTIASYIIHSATSFEFDAEEAIHCFPIKLNKSVQNNESLSNVIGNKCIVDQRYTDFSMELTTSVYAADNSATKKGSSLALSLNAIVRSPKSKIAREVLVETVSTIEKNVVVNPNNDDSEVVKELDVAWNIFEKHVPLPASSEQDELDITAQVESTQSCVEERIFDNDRISYKKQITKATNEVGEYEVWEYTTSSDETVRDLFIHSNLRATTSAIGRAHAEAFVHPAMNSHPLPKRVAVISEMPVAYVKEILKYEDVKDITLLGADQSYIRAVANFMPNLDDCSAINTVSDACLDDTKVEIVEKDVSSWVNEMVEKGKGIEYDTTCIYDKDAKKYSLCAPEPRYDIIFIDAATADKAQEWLASDVYQLYLNLITYDSAIVINIGSAPKGDGTQNMNALEDVLETITEGEPPESWASLFLYDEVSARKWDIDECIA